MSNASRRPRKTVEDYLALPEDVRAELIGGELYVTPAPHLPHQRVVVSLLHLLVTYLEDHARGEVFVAPVDVYLPTGDVVQPDLVFVSSARRSILEDHVRGAPDLVIEVLSPTRPERDRFVKRVLYERSGVPEYWIVDPEERSVEVLRLGRDGYEPGRFVTGDQVLTSPTLEGLTVSLSRLFASV